MAGFFLCFPPTERNGCIKMNLLKKIATGLLAAAMLVSVAACHPKDETAMTIGDIKITSGLYVCALLMADSEGRDRVTEENEEANGSDSTSSSTSSNIDFYKQKIDDTDFSAWVRNRAEEICKEYALYDTKFAENGLSLDEETLNQVDTYAEYYWNQYGLSQVYEPNGASFQTYKKFFTYQYMTQTYFLSIYGEEGTNPVPAEDIKTSLNENFVAAQTLTGSYTTDSTTGSSTALTDEEKTALKEKFEGYLQRLQAGESFETIYKEQNPDDTTNSSETEDGPKDPYITILGSENTTNASDNFEEVKGMAVDEVKLLEDDSKGLTLVVRKDINDDEYYYNYLKEAVLYILKQDEFEKNVKEAADALPIEKNNFAINQFKPKNIKYPQNTAA